MTTAIVSMALALAMGTTTGQPAGWSPAHPGGWIMPPGPGYGWGFPNGNPDGYGWVSYEHYLPLGADRTADYYFRRYYAIPADQMFFPTYYNPYTTRGQRYIPYVGTAPYSSHPAGGPPLASADTPSHPYRATIGSGPAVQVPRFSGRVEAPPVTSGTTGLTP